LEIEGLMQFANAIEQVPVNIPDVGPWRWQSRQQCPHLVGAHMRGDQAIEQVHDSSATDFELSQAVEQRVEFRPEIVRLA
jgi:hypothetical protein